MKRIAAATASILMALAVNANAADAKEEKTASGIVITTMKEGVGANPQSTSVVKVHYRGTLPDGTEFDSSYKRGQPATFALNRVIPCWTEGVQTMKAGGKVKLVCPPNLAYGSRGVGTIPPNATLVFEVELLEIVK
jgi:FKBP-type peptidyl-prolyl cis-trans isomerase FkpA